MADKEQFITPAAQAHFPYISTPDTEYDEDGVFKTNLVLDSSNPAHKKFIAQVKKLHDEAYKTQCAIKGKKLKKAPYPVKPFEPREDSPLEGNTVVGPFKTKAKGETKGGKVYTKVVPLFDARKNDITDSCPDIWGGTVMKVAFSVGNYSNKNGAGLSMFLNGIQVLELVTGNGGSKDADGFGFDTEDDYDEISSVSSEETEEDTDEPPFEEEEDDIDF